MKWKLPTSCLVLLLLRGLLLFLLSAIGVLLCVLGLLLILVFWRLCLFFLVGNTLAVSLVYDDFDVLVACKLEIFGDLIKFVSLIRFNLLGNTFNVYL